MMGGIGPPISVIGPAPPLFSQTWGRPSLKRSRSYSRAGREEERLLERPHVARGRVGSRAREGWS